MFMKRRNFIQGISALSALSMLPEQIKAANTQNTVKAKKLQPGDKVGIIAPATSVSDPDEIIRAKNAAEFFGLVPVLGKNVAKGSGYKSRTVNERIEDLHSMFGNTEIKAVFCIRGGYGSPQILDDIDYDLIRKNPKIFLGYSDITAMHLAINKMAGLVTFHGPVLSSAFTQYTIDSFMKTLFESNPLGVIANPLSTSSIRPLHPLRTVKPGKAEGKIIGGNLSLITALMGTPYEIDTKDKILLIEDVGEEPFRIDRMLTQLKLAKKLQSSKGVVFGECNGCNFDGLQTSRVWDFTYGEVLDRIFEDIDIPVFTGLTVGHTSDQATIPFGVSAIMDADICNVNILESALTD